MGILRAVWIAPRGFVTSFFMEGPLVYMHNTDLETYPNAWIIMKKILRKRVHRFLTPVLRHIIYYHITKVKLELSPPPAYPLYPLSLLPHPSPFPLWSHWSEWAQSIWLHGFRQWACEERFESLQVVLLLFYHWRTLNQVRMLFSPAYVTRKLGYSYRYVSGVC